MGEQSAYVILTFKYVGGVLLRVELNERDAELLGIIFILLDVVYICHSVICFGSIGYDVWKASRQQITEGNEDAHTNVVPTRTQKDAYTIAALRMRASVQEALKIKAMQKATQIVPLKSRNNLAKIIEKSIRKNKVETIQNNHEFSHNNRKKRLQQRQTERHNSVQARLEARRQAKQTNALQKSAIFCELDDASISTIIDLMEYQVIPKTDTEICKQGEFAEILYLIITGTCKVIRNGKEIAVLTQENGIFGEGALYPDKNGIALRGATVSAGSEDGQLLCLSKEKFDRLVASNTLNEDCMNKLNKIAEKRAKENDASAKEDEGDNGDKDALEKICNKIDLDKSNSIDQEEFQALLTATMAVKLEDVLFEKVWNIVLSVGNEDSERKNSIDLLRFE